jgi:predicted secreted protein
MNKGIIPVCVENAVTTICFTALAIYFKHWWIVLFAMFVYTSLKKRGVDDE